MSEREREQRDTGAEDYSIIAPNHNAQLEKLNTKCLDIYVSQIEKDAKTGETTEHTIYLLLRSDGYNGWNVELSEENMQVIVGDLAAPEY